MEGKILLEMRNIHKRFPGVYALRGVKLEVRSGEVHALLGENGAGKSTLIKVLGGIYDMEEGEILMEGRPVKIKNVYDAKDAGISIIHQELMLVPHLTVAENVFLGREPKNRAGFIDYSHMNRVAGQALNSFDLTISPETVTARLTIAQQQMVEIIKATSVNAKIIVMDEPTSSLADKEVERLFAISRRLTEQGVGIIYISHRMSELEQIADRVTVLRDGEYVSTKDIKDTNRKELINMMVGRELSSYYTRTFNSCAETVLKVEGLSNEKIHDVSFELKKGEILGFAGLIGAGRSETMKAIFGIDKTTRGTVTLENKPIQGKTPSQIIRMGIGLVPENRKEEGLFLQLSLKFNITLKIVKEFIKGVYVNTKKEDAAFNECVRSLAVKAPGGDTPMYSLSGGNQQKAVIGSWLAVNPKALILDEPTKGIDVGAKSEIYANMDNLAKKGISIIMVSSELPEILNMSDRIVVMRDGTISAILDHSEASQEKIMRYSVKE